MPTPASRKTTWTPARRTARRSDPPFLLTVLTGPNAGAGLRLKDGTVSIGAGETDDVVLDGVAPGAVRISLRGLQARIRPADGSDMIADYDAGCAAGRTTRVALPARLQIDGRTAIHLCRIVPLRSGWTAWVPTVLVGVVACGMGMLVITRIDLGAPASARDAVAVETAAAAPSAAARRVAGACTACAADAATALRRMLDTAGLATVTAVADGGAVRAGGTHAADQATAWGVVRRSYDEAWGSRVPLVAAVATAEPEAPFAVESVWLGAQPELRTRGGLTLRPGDVTADGWRVETIKAGLVGLVRADQQLQIAF